MAQTYRNRSTNVDNHQVVDQLLIGNVNPAAPMVIDPQCFADLGKLCHSLAAQGEEIKKRSDEVVDKNAQLHAWIINTVDYHDKVNSCSSGKKGTLPLPVPSSVVHQQARSASSCN